MILFIKRAASPRLRHSGSVNTFWMMAWRPETMSILPLALVCGCGGTSRNCTPAPATIRSGSFSGTGEPAEVIFSLKHLPKRIPRLDPKGFKQIQRQLAHVLKHAGAMPADEIDIGRGREAKLKSVRHRSNPFQ